MSQMLSIFSLCLQQPTKFHRFLLLTLNLMGKWEQTPATLNCCQFPATAGRITAPCGITMGWFLILKKYHTPTKNIHQAEAVILFMAWLNDIFNIYSIIIRTWVHVILYNMRILSQVPAWNLKLYIFPLLCAILIMINTLLITEPTIYHHVFSCFFGPTFSTEALSGMKLPACPPPGLTPLADEGRAGLKATESRPLEKVRKEINT